MKKYSTKQKKPSQPPRLKTIPRAWILATRLEHRRVKGKNRKKPGKEG